MRWKFLRRPRKLAAAILQQRGVPKDDKGQGNGGGALCGPALLLRDFQNLQTELHRQQMEGVEVTPEQEEQLQNLFGVISINPYIRELIEAEFAFQRHDAAGKRHFGPISRLKRGRGKKMKLKAPKLEVPEKRILIPGKDI